jgi:SAM-dependent methyltransferase
MQPFPAEALADVREGARRSARQVVPFLGGLLRPRSVVDLGCGSGSWLAAFQDCGVADVLGVDAAVPDPALLDIPRERFLAHDLTRPLELGRSFDVALALEVAEHLPSACAEGFVDTLVRLAPVVLFSAAVPFQGGYGHVHERWPDYWAGLFEARGFPVLDCLRERFWLNDQVEWWYAQNMLLYVRGDVLLRHPLLRRELSFTRRAQLALVHPRCYLQAVARADQAARAAQAGLAVPPDPPDGLRHDRP